LLLSASTASTVSELSPEKKVRINKNWVGSEKWGQQKARPKVDAVDLCVQNPLVKLCVYKKSFEILPALRQTIMKAEHFMM